MDEPTTQSLERNHEQTRKINQEMQRMNRLGERFSGVMVRAFRDVAIRGKSFSDVLRGLGRQLAEMALNAAAKPIGQALGAGLAGLLGVGGTKKGVSAFAQGGVVASPTYFPLAGGRTGLMGERGAEAIMPLARGPDGRLGVRASAGGAAAGNNITFNISTPDVEGFRRSQSQVAAMLSRTVSQGQRNL